MNQLSQIIAREVPGFSTVARQTVIRTRSEPHLQFTVTDWREVDCVIRAPRVIEVVAHDAGEMTPWAVKRFPTRSAAMNWIETHLPF
jgi:hypothetical protein